MVYQNGGLVKEFAAITERLKRGIGHRMAIGAMWNGSAFVGSGANAYIAFSALRIYKRQLSRAEILQNMKSCGSDGVEPWVTNGLLEGWLARDATGTTLPALVNPANNGSIIGGSVQRVKAVN